MLETRFASPALSQGAKISAAFVQRRHLEETRVFAHAARLVSATTRGASCFASSAPALGPAGRTVARGRRAWTPCEPGVHPGVLERSRPPRGTLRGRRSTTTVAHYVKLVTTTWDPSTPSVTLDDYTGEADFGFSVAMTDDWALVDDQRKEGIVFKYNETADGAKRRRTYFTRNAVRFGYDVALVGDTIAGTYPGSILEDNTATSGVFVFYNNSGVWDTHAIIRRWIVAGNDHHPWYGKTVAIADDFAWSDRTAECLRTAVTADQATKRQLEQRLPR